MPDLAFGTYTGDATATRDIPVPFTPTFVFDFIYLAGFGGAHWRNSAFDTAGAAGAVTFPTGSTSARISALITNAFRCSHTSTTYTPNNNAQRYDWVACRDDSETAMLHGTYTGNGAGNRVIGCGAITPVFILLFDATTTISFWWRHTHDLGQYSIVGNSSTGLVGNYIIGGAAGNFTVHSNLNTAGRNYFWTAFAATPGFFNANRYTGVSGDNRNISMTSPQFKPAFIWMDIQQVATSYSGWLHADTVNPGDITQTWRAGSSVAVADYIQGTNSTGFQVGTQGNYLNEIYHYSCWGQAQFAPSTTIELPPPATFGGGQLNFSPYTKYKSMRAATQIYNNLIIGP